MNPKSKSPTDEMVHQIAELADVDERTVWKHIAGGQVRPRASRRIDAAIDELNKHREQETENVDDFT